MRPFEDVRDTWSRIVFGATWDSLAPEVRKGAAESLSYQRLMLRWQIGQLVEIIEQETHLVAWMRKVCAILVRILARLGRV